MANDLITSEAIGKPPSLPTWAQAVSVDQWIGGEWETRKAIAQLDPNHLSAIAAAVETANARRQPMLRERLLQRLTALGMVLSPNRSPADGAMWVRETARLLNDIAEDVLCEAIDTLQKRMKFLPTVAEIRELCDREMEKRNREYSRLDAMRRYIESGQPMPKHDVSPPKHLMDRRGQPMSDEDTAELNAILESVGATKRYRSDGTRFDA